MSCFSILILMALAVADEPNPSALVRLLGSSDRVERDEAAITLEELGPAALPALQLAEKNEPEPSRSRAKTLARTIEGRNLERPKLVAVDFDGQPLDEVIQTLANRSGYRLQLDAGDNAGLPRRAIVARTPAPVPFWQALDLVGQAGQVRHGPEPAPWYWVTSPTSLLHLVDGKPPANALYRGPFRVHLLSLHRRRDRELGNSPNRPPVSKAALYVDLQLFAEPGRFLDHDAVPRIEAIDDQGRAIPAPPANAESPRPDLGQWNSPGALGMLHWRLPLGLPGPDAHHLKRLRGTLPVLVSATRPNPLVISLDDPPGRSYRSEDTTLQFRIVEDTTDSLQIDLTIEREGSGSSSRDDRPVAVLRHRIGFEDVDGKPIAWMHQYHSIAPDGKPHSQILVSPAPRPIRMRFHEVVWTSVEVPFEYVDVPLP